MTEQYKTTSGEIRIVTNSEYKHTNGERLTLKGYDVYSGIDTILYSQKEEDYIKIGEIHPDDRLSVDKYLLDNKTKIHPFGAEPNYTIIYCILINDDDYEDEINIMLTKLTDKIKKIENKYLDELNFYKSVCVYLYSIHDKNNVPSLYNKPEWTKLLKEKNVY